MSKHTPGPWTAERMFIPSGEKDRRSGFVVNGPDIGSLLVRICDIRCSPEVPFEVAEQNARLIAAAPDLLSAARKVAHIMRTGATPADARLVEQQLLAAIAKAEGPNP